MSDPIEIRPFSKSLNSIPGRSDFRPKNDSVNADPKGSSVTEYAEDSTSAPSQESHSSLNQESHASVEKENSDEEIQQQTSTQPTLPGNLTLPAVIPPSIQISGSQDVMTLNPQTKQS